MIYSCSLLMVRLQEFVLTRDIFPLLPMVSNFSALFSLGCCSPQGSGSSMQPPPAAATVLWGLLLSLDLLSAQQPEPNRGDRKVPNEKNRQPHIVFILIDDQVSRGSTIAAC